VLVTFGIRGGRLCRWSQRACGAAAARRRLDHTAGASAGIADVSPRFRGNVSRNCVERFRGDVVLIFVYAIMDMTCTSAAAGPSPLASP
jgi:hypothetical protein